MKKIILALVVVSLMFSSCSIIDDLTKVDLPFEKTVTIPGMPDMPDVIPSSGIPLDNLPDFEIDTQSKFEENGLNKDLVEEVLLKQLELSVKLPEGGTLDFLKSIKIFIMAEGLSETKIAWKEDISDDLSSLKLEMSEVDLSEYIKKDKFILKMDVVIDQAPQTDYTLNIKTVFLVDVKVLGI